MALLTAGMLATPTPVLIDSRQISINIYITIEGVREPFHAFLITAEDKANIHHIVCPQDFVYLTPPYQEDLSNAIVKR